MFAATEEEVCVFGRNKSSKIVEVGLVKKAERRSRRRS